MVERSNVRFFGNVEVGTDVSVEELKSRYSALVFAYGADKDRTFNLPGMGNANIGFYIFIC